MKFQSLEPFVPSGSNYEGAKELFQDLGFIKNWDAGDYAGFEKDGCRFILQKFSNKEFAENFMISVKVDNVAEFREAILEKGLDKKYGIRISKPMNQPYGKEVNLIDLAGVCWHLIE